MSEKGNDHVDPARITLLWLISNSSSLLCEAIFKTSACLVDYITATAQRTTNHARKLEKEKFPQRKWLWIARVYNFSLRHADQQEKWLHNGTKKGYPDTHKHRTHSAYPASRTRLLNETEELHQRVFHFKCIFFIHGGSSLYSVYLSLAWDARASVDCGGDAAAAGRCRWPVADRWWGWPEMDHGRRRRWGSGRPSWSHSRAGSVQSAGNDAEPRVLAVRVRIRVAGGHAGRPTRGWRSIQADAEVVPRWCMASTRNAAWCLASTSGSVAWKSSPREDPKLSSSNLDYQLLGEIPARLKISVIKS